jgi:hypothetical protein
MEFMRNVRDPTTLRLSKPRMLLPQRGHPRRTKTLQANTPDDFASRIKLEMEKLRVLGPADRPDLAPADRKRVNPD